nr:uncharacterized protein LOC114822917 [Malus domestica]
MHAPISPREEAHHPSSPRPALSLSLPLVPATPENRKRSSGEIFQSPVRTKSKPGVSTPNSGDLGGFSGHLRPFHDERKGQLLVTFSCSLVCVTLRRLSIVSGPLQKHVLIVEMHT